MAEQIILDPAEEIDGRTEVDITPVMKPEGVQWPPTTNAPYYADGAVGQVVIYERWNNREVTIPLVLKDTAGTAFATWRSLLQAKVGEFQGGRGGVLKRVTNAGTVYADILSARFTAGGSWTQAHKDYDTDSLLELVLGSENYGEELADTTDDFAAALAGRPWAFDVGSGTIDAFGGQLVPTSTVEKRLYRTDVTYYDLQATLKITTATGLPAFQAGVLLKWIDARNYIAVTLDQLGVLNIRSVVNGGSTVHFNGSQGMPMAQNTSYWIRGRIEGDVVTVEAFTSVPTLGSLPYSGIGESVTLTGAVAAALGEGVKGRPGLRITPSGSLLTSFDDFSAQPNVYVGRGAEVLSAPIYGIAGDFPPGNRCRVKVAEGSGVNRRGLIAAFRSRDAAMAETAALAYEANALLPLDTAAASALAGASGNTAVRYPNLATDWTPVLQLSLADGTYLTHAGTYRLRARVYASDASVSVRAVYDVGDMINPAENARWTFPESSNFFVADLGELRLERAPVDDHRWVGQIQAKGATAGHEFWIDKVWLVPVDTFAATATAARGMVGLTSIPARDDFAQTRALAITGQTSTSRHTWAGAGDADDFVTTGTAIQRSATGDASSTLGRFVTLGPALSDMIVKVNVTAGLSGALYTNDRFGVVARYVDARNWIFAGWSGTSGGAFEVATCVAGVLNVKSYVANPSSYLLAQQGQAVQLTVDTDGNYDAGYYIGEAYESICSGFNFNLVPTGTLASGRAGILDCHTNATATTRTYDSFLVKQSTADAALYANREAELRTDGLYRQDTTGTAYGKISNAIGNLPRVPCGDGRPVEALLIPSRGDFATLADHAIEDHLAMQVLYRPCWLGVPEA